MENDKKHKSAKISLILIIFIVSIFSVSASYFYDLSYICEGGICIEGQQMKWNITLFQQGYRSSSEFTKIELLDAVNHKILATYELAYSPFKDESGKLIEVDKLDDVYIFINSTVPNPIFRKNLIYYPCFTKAVTESFQIAKYNKYEDTQCYNENFSIPIIECLHDSQCKTNKRCISNLCENIYCGECQFAENNTCNNYECCSSLQCESDQLCKNNNCVNLDCKENELVINRTCVPIICGFDEYIESKVCKKLNCTFDEYIFNHTCKKLECNGFEIIKDNDCKECPSNQIANNNSCVDIKCSFDEEYFDHSCKKLECGLFADAKDHYCVHDNFLVFKLILELFIVGVIVFLLFMDIKKYKKNHITESEDKIYKPDIKKEKKNVIT